MKPAWDTLMAEYKDSATVLIGDVDCTAEGKPLCGEHGVRGFPTIKHGDPADLQDYKGGRDVDSLKKFASENLGPTCGPGNLDLCDADKKAQIDGFLAMAPEALATQVSEKEAELKKTEDDLQEMLKSLQDQYKKGQEANEAAKAAIKESGLGLMKAVQAHKKKSKAEL